jgi:hypothetical protein
MASGEVCWTGQAANCCPQGTDGGQQLCEPTILGVRRCFAPGTPDECIPDGGECNFADECCGGLCLPDPDGGYFCSDTCVPVEGACTTSADCCDGVCIQQQCEPNTFGCIPLGTTCTTDEDCCTGLCSDGVCAVPYT